MVGKIVLQVLFWAGVGHVVYTYVGYPLLLWVVARSRNARRALEEITPAVTVLIAAYNEERVIEAKIENTLALDYPRDRLQIIVASDASDDGTDEIVQRYASSGVELSRMPERRGKVAALRAAEDRIRGEVVVISDADSMYEPDAVRKMVRHFSDPKVGAVSGQEIRTPAASGRGQGEGLYCRYDNLIKALEGRVGNQSMVNGGFFAARRTLLPQVPDDLCHDGVLPYSLALQGYRTAYAPEALSFEVYGLESNEDWSRRVRTCLQGIHIFIYMRAALNPFRTGFYAIQMLSHRICRYLVLPAMALALVSNALLAGHGPVYPVLFALQIAFYLLALIGFGLERVNRRPRPFYFPFYFVLLHAAAFWGVLLGLSGKQMATCRPTRRETA